MPATPIKKLLSYEEKNRCKSARKSKKHNICNGIRLYNRYLLIKL